MYRSLWQWLSQFFNPTTHSNITSPPHPTTPTHPLTQTGKGGFLCHWTAVDEAGTKFKYTSGSPDTLRNSYGVPISPREFANCTCRGGDNCPRTAVYPDVITFKPASCERLSGGLLVKRSACPSMTALLYY
jgi:hypothetical protein